MFKEDTIAAIATPPGIGALGIVRASGPQALATADRIFKNPKNRRIQDMDAYTAAYGFITGKDDRVIDEVVLLVMRKPHSFTGEDMVEVIGHGGPVPLQGILQRFLDEGVRLAERGEFTKRAFLNERIDLSQAEAVLEIIQARTERGLSLAVNQLHGSLSGAIRKTRESLLDLLVYTEAKADFPEDEIDGFKPADIEKILKEAMAETEKIIEGGKRGCVFRDGVRTVIIGRPNVGKSTLLNALLGEERALVTCIPGTTRDSVEEIINVGGIPLRLIDTAGLRETEDPIELLGVARTKELLMKGDLILAVCDVTEGIIGEDLEIIHLVDPEKGLVVINKVDLKKEVDIGPLQEWFAPEDIIFISAREGRGMQKVLAAIYRKINTKAGLDEDFFLTNMRQQQALKEAKQAIKRAVAALEEGIPEDLVAVDIRGAINALGRITGETIGIDITGEIFSRFCIGK